MEIYGSLAHSSLGKMVKLLIDVLSVLALARLLAATCSFAVDGVQKPATPLATADPQAAITRKLRVTPESYFSYPESLNPVEAEVTKNSFVGAVHAAYDNHYPLVLSPDMIWQCVVQGFAIHVNKNAETLRHMFVTHQGRARILVRRDNFTKGRADNNWEGVFGEFSDRIREYIGNETHSLLTPEFSTTGPVERAAAQVVLMDAFKEYFEYVVRTACGIPEITLKGTVEDWEKLREKTLSLARFNLQWWIDAIGPILDEFVSASSGNINREFWQSIYKNVNPGSGGPFINGWILTLFPYLGWSVRNMERNPYLDSWDNDPFRYYHGATTDSFPSGSVSTPFLWQYFDLQYNMSFYAGFLGVGQDNVSFALQPVIGWAVVDGQDEEQDEEQVEESNINMLQYDGGYLTCRPSDSGICTS